MSDTPLELAVQSALLDANGGFTGRKLIGELSSVARWVISALNKQGVSLSLATDEEISEAWRRGELEVIGCDDRRIALRNLVLHSDTLSDDEFISAAREIVK